MKEFEYVGDGLVLDTRLGEELHKCPYEGGSGACPYWVYIEDHGYYCYDDMLDYCELGK